MKKLPLVFGPVTRIVVGGPFRQAPKGFIRVKMAKEINADHEINIPTRDFDVPNPNDLTYGLQEALWHIAVGRPVYVGCMGGIGRTGLFMAVLVKVIMPEVDPVAYVRATYNSHAVETEDQRRYIKGFPVGDLQRLFKKYQRTAHVVTAYRALPKWIQRVFNPMFDKLVKSGRIV